MCVNPRKSGLTHFVEIEVDAGLSNMKYLWHLAPEVAGRRKTDYSDIAMHIRWSAIHGISIFKIGADWKRETGLKTGLGFPHLIRAHTLSYVLIRGLDSSHNRRSGTMNRAEISFSKNGADPSQKRG